MDLTVLSRKISSYRTPKGRITKLPNELLGEILHAWEQWSGSPAGFYSQLGCDYRKMGSIMGKAKQLKRDGAFDGLNFTEVIVEEVASSKTSTIGCSEIELVWDNNKIIRFKTPELLVEFLKKAA
jgi:capsid protein